MHTEQSLAADIRALGVTPTDLLTVHTSLKKVGTIDTSQKSGAEVLIDALRSCVSEGLLMIPAHTFRNVREEPVFDIRRTKPCIGAVPCVAVEMANRAVDAGDPTCVRSLHVSHSVVAFGARAQEFVQGDRIGRTRTPMTGSYGKLYYENGKILLLGVDLTCNTFIHAVDEVLYSVTDEIVPITVTDYDGSTWVHAQHATSGPASASFERYRGALEKAGAVTYGKVGDADAMLIDARKCFGVVAYVQTVMPEPIDP